MDALIASYGDCSSSESELESESESPAQPTPLPPPPLSLLTPPNSFFAPLDNLQTGQPSRVRSFPHVEGNYALHVYIPVQIPQPARKEAAKFLRKVSLNFPGLHVVDADIALENLHSDDQKVEHIALGREFHISLGRTVPIRVHQIDSVAAMLRQKLQSQKQYWIDFSNWEVFVNDDSTRTFLSIEVKTGGLPEVIGDDSSDMLIAHFLLDFLYELIDKLGSAFDQADGSSLSRVMRAVLITKQIQTVNEVYRLHNLPEFYKDPRPHISVAWASGDVSDLLKRVIEEESKKHPTIAGPSLKRVFTVKFNGVECKIGNKSYKICKLPGN